MLVIVMCILKVSIERICVMEACLFAVPQCSLTQVEWATEQACFETLGRELSLFYAYKPGLVRGNSTDLACSGTTGSRPASTDEATANSSEASRQKEVS